MPSPTRPPSEVATAQAVRSAEQVIQGQPGAVKFDSAAHWLPAAAARFDIKLTSGEIKSFIEAAVYDLNVAQGKKVAPPAPATSGV